MGLCNPTGARGMSWLCCCCTHGNASPLNADEARGILQRTDEARDELELFAAMWCRSSKVHALQRQLPQIGTRQRKHFCWVAGANQSGGGGGGYFGWLFPSAGRAVLSVAVCERTVGLHERGHLERALRVEHPYLLSILAADFPRPDRVVVVREWCSGGSLRDLLHGAAPDDEQTDKYDRVGTPLSEAKIALIGRGLLEALLVLRPLGEKVALHVHLGNVFLESADGLVPRVSEWEQGLLGLPSHLEAYFHDLRRAVEPSAAALALCVYEMACGFELDGLPAVIPPTCPTAVREALETLLRPPAPRSSRADVHTLEEARELPLFATAALGGTPGAAPTPLPPDVLQHAKEAGKGRC